MAIGRYVLHAGNSQDYPENSLPAIRHVPKQITAVECDIINTKDNHWVLMHNLTVDATTNGTGYVQDMTLAQIRELRLDVGPNIDNLDDADKVVPTLAEYLQICVDNGVIPIIELRKRNYSVEAYLSLINTISQYSSIADVVLMCFDSDILVKLREYMPNVVIWYLVYDLSDDTLAIAKRYKFDVNILQSAEDLTLANVQKYQQNGVKVGTWTMYDWTMHQELLALNVDYITTTLNDAGL